jgi:hypothetical protein
MPAATFLAGLDLGLYPKPPETPSANEGIIMVFGKQAGYRACLF